MGRARYRRPSGWTTAHGVLRQGSVSAGTRPKGVGKVSAALLLSRGATWRLFLHPNPCPTEVERSVPEETGTSCSTHVAAAWGHGAPGETVKIDYLGQSHSIVSSPPGWWLFVMPSTEDFEAVPHQRPPI
jgi:hypothetical protein